MVLSAAWSVSSCKKDEEQKKEEPTYTVRFDSKGGTPTPQQQTVKEGGKVEQPADPTRERTPGFVSGWQGKNGNHYGLFWHDKKQACRIEEQCYPFHESQPKN